MRIKALKPAARVRNDPAFIYTYFNPQLLFFFTNLELTVIVRGGECRRTSLPEQASRGRSFEMYYGEFCGPEKGYQWLRLLLSIRYFQRLEKVTI